MARDRRGVKSIFDEAAEIASPEARAAYLERCCGGDPELRDKIDALLRALDEAGSFLEACPNLDATGASDALVPRAGPEAAPEGMATTAGSAVTDPSGTPAFPTLPSSREAPFDAPAVTRPSDDGPDLIGTIVADRYKLRQEIGEGGMGTVFLAEQLRPVRRQVALKLIKRGMDSRSVLARFESERQALALMEHPNIARVLDAGTAADGRPFFVMELVKGIPITEYCDAHRLGLNARLALFRQVCSAVQHAHQKGIIHRDLKPSNVLVESHDDRPVPKVIDFGLAKATSGLRLTEQSLFTAFGSVAGTPLYMAPEQARFNALDVDTRADIYALGVILYELLTGSTPIARETLKRAALDEMLRVIREEEPPTPSSRISTSGALPSVAAARHVEPARLSRLVRGDLDWIVMKALAKERERRYDSAIGLGNDVERFVNHEPVSAGPPTAAYRLRKFVRRNRAQVAAAALVLLALVLGVVGTTLGLLEARRQARRAEAQEAVARAEAAAKEEARRAEADERRHAEARLGQVTKMNEILGSIFRDLHPNTVAKLGKPLAAALGERLDRATAEIEGEATGDPLAVARMQMSLGEAQRGLGYSAKAAALFEKARATRAARLGPDHPDTLTSLRHLAGSYDKIGRRDEALRLREQALARAKAKLGPDHPNTIWSMADLAGSYADAGRRDEALRLNEEVLALRRAKLGPDHPATIASLHSLATNYADVGRRDEALKLREEVLTLRRAKLGPDHPDTIWSMAALALSYADTGRLDEALKLREEALALRRAKLGPDHPDTIVSLDDLAASYADAGRLDEALKLREEVLAFRRAKLGPDHPATIGGMAALAHSYAEAGRRDEALKLREEALALRRAKLGPDHPDTIWSMADLAASYADAGRRDEALKLREQVLALRKAKLGPDHPETLQAKWQLAQALQDVGYYDRAEPLWDDLVLARRRAGGDGDPATLAARLDRADLDLVRGRLDAAEPAYRALVDECRARLGPNHGTTFRATHNLGDLVEKRGDPAAAAALYRAIADGARASGNRTWLPRGLVRLGRAEIALKAWPEAEAHAREALALYLASQPDGWSKHLARSIIGAALLGQGKTAEAGPLLRSGYEGLAKHRDAIPPVFQPWVAEALDRLIAWAEAAGKADEVKAWKAERAKLATGGPKP